MDRRSFGLMAASLVTAPMLPNIKAIEDVPTCNVWKRQNYPWHKGKPWTFYNLDRFKYLKGKNQFVWNDDNEPLGFDPNGTMFVMANKEEKWFYYIPAKRYKKPTIVNGKYHSEAWDAANKLQQKAIDLNYEIVESIWVTYKGFHGHLVKYKTESLC